MATTNGFQKNQAQLGQFFTKNESLQNKVYEYILNEPTNILEPSIGRGDLVVTVLKRDPNIVFDMYEIDESIEMLNLIKKEDIHYGDFMIANITKKYKTIIGNPPYVRTKKGNLYIDITDKCYELLDDNGELIFIVPSDFLKLTCASKLLDKMMKNGTFTHIYHPNNENLFDNAKIDVIVFRYCKNNELEKKVIYNDTLMHITNTHGFVTLNESINNNKHLFEEYFDIYVGIVTGKEEVYKNNRLGNIEVLNGSQKNQIEKYIFIEEYPSNNIDIDNYLLQHKNVLINRKIRKFNEDNWFEWGAPRNISIVRENFGRQCIYVYNLTRHITVAFIGTVQYFGGNLILMIPKFQYNLVPIVDYLNSNIFKQNFMFSNRFKIGHRQLCLSTIPIQFVTSNIPLDVSSNIPLDVSSNIPLYDKTISEIINVARNIDIFKQYKSNDGRIDSAIREEPFLNELKQRLLLNNPNWNIIISPPRDQCDIIVNTIKINLKLTNCKTADNSVNKPSIFYSITGQDYPYSSTWNNFLDKLIDANNNNKIKKQRDILTEYHYLVKNKLTGDVLLKSIFDIHTYISNPSNDLQINWNNEFENQNYYTNNSNYLIKVRSLINCIQKSVKDMIERTNRFAYADFGFIINNQNSSLLVNINPIESETKQIKSKKDLIDALKKIKPLSIDLNIYENKIKTKKNNNNTIGISLQLAKIGSNPDIAIDF